MVVSPIFFIIKDNTYLVNLIFAVKKLLLPIQDELALINLIVRL